MTSCLVIALGMVAGSPLRAQATAGTISGLVRDTSGLAVAGADVAVRPGVHRTRTDSTGRFVVSGLGADKYTVVARKVGFAPTSFDVSLRKDGHVDITITS